MSNGIKWITPAEAAAKRAPRDRSGALIGIRDYRYIKPRALEYGGAENHAEAALNRLFDAYADALKEESTY